MPIPDPVELFGIHLHPCRMTEAVDELCDWIAAEDAGRCRYVVTPNVNHAVLLQRHEQFARVYADADFVLADGVPIVLLARIFRRGVPERVAGSDLVPELFDRARVDAPIRVYLLGARPEVNERATRAVEARWPGIQVVGRDSPPFGFEQHEVENARILDQIAAARPDVLIVGLGAPKQELWVHQHRDRIRAKIALCVGATIDFLAGEKSRAPHWMRRSGLEWMHRIALEPKRLSGRYLRDGLALPGLVFREFRHSVTRRKPFQRPNPSRKPL
jgi:N-acetylglucosaminyldiphosphoundecaprenol N-acetyl-beta-D-mannosaminyltransferase